MSDAKTTESMPPMPAKSSTDGKRTALAVVNFVLAGLHLFGGGFLLAAHLFLSFLDLPFQLYTTAGGQTDADTPFGASAQAAVASAMVQLMMVIPMITSGVGLLKRRQWALTLGIVIGFTAGAFALWSVIALRLVEAAWFGAYSIFALVLLHQIKHTSDIEDAG